MSMYDKNHYSIVISLQLILKNFKKWNKFCHYIKKNKTRQTKQNKMHNQVVHLQDDCTIFLLRTFVKCIWIFFLKERRRKHLPKSPVIHQTKMYHKESSPDYMCLLSEERVPAWPQWSWGHQTAVAETGTKLRHARLPWLEVNRSLCGSGCHW